VFNVTKTVTEMLDREERKIFEAKLLQELGSIKTSIDNMKVAVVNALAEQSKLLDKRFQELIDGQKDLKSTFEIHQKIMKEQLTQLNQINVNLEREN
jgi:energy-converting hydrogenase A subunit M